MPHCSDTLERSCIAALIALIVAVSVVLMTPSSAPAAAANYTRPQTVVYSKIGPIKLLADIYRPPGWTARNRRPVVLLIHGGGWWMGNRGQLRQEARSFAKAGYVAVSVDYRLSCRPAAPKRELLPFVNLRPGETVYCGTGVYRHAHTMRDLHAAVEYLYRNQRQLGINPALRTYAGFSAGGHLALRLADNTSPLRHRPQTVIVYSGPSSLPAMNRLKSGVMFALARHLGCAYAECPKAWIAASPRLNWPKRPANLIVVASRGDASVAFADQQQLVLSARRRGARATLLTINGSCHGAACERAHYSGGGASRTWWTVMRMMRLPDRA